MGARLLALVVSRHRPSLHLPQWRSALPRAAAHLPAGASGELPPARRALPRAAAHLPAGARGKLAPARGPPPPRPRHPPHLRHLPPPHGIKRGRVALLRAAALPQRSGPPPPRRGGPPPPPRVALLRCGEEEAGVRGSGPRRRSPWPARRAGPRAAAQPWRAEPAPAWRPASPPPRASPARQGGAGSAAGEERGREREGKGRSGGRGREGKRSDEGREREEICLPAYSDLGRLLEELNFRCECFLLCKTQIREWCCVWTLIVGDSLTWNKRLYTTALCRYFIGSLPKRFFSATSIIKS